MKKALIIANMLFASATVFGMEFRKADVEEATRRSNCSIIEDVQYQQVLWESEEEYQYQQALWESKQEYLLQQAIAESKKEADAKGKEEAGKDISEFLQKAIEIKNIELEEPFNQKIPDNFISNASISDDRIQYLSNVGFMNPGDYTLRTLTILKNQSEYKFMQRDHDSRFNGLNSQCPILALGVDETTRIKLQQQKAVGENTTLGEYMNKTGGLDPYDYNNWEAIAKALGRRIDIWVFPGQGKDDVDEAFYHVGGQLNMILSYGVNLGNNVKRLRFDSAYDPNTDKSSRVAGHYIELRIFNKDGSQVE
ncbi:MAG: hypothetical protein K5766_02025 [Alphaproteobacteria bacterium]|nr:hypothetical protein [Alphaproteobacteria bacterium]